MSETLSGGLTLVIPVIGETNWSQLIKNQCFVPLSSHDHTGGGKGTKIGTSALVDDSVDDTKVRLRNNNWLRGRNAANSGDVNLFRVNTSDQLEFPAASISGSSLAADSIDDTRIRLRNNQWLRARNAANNADLSLLRADSGDHTVINGGTGKNVLVGFGGSGVWQFNATSLIPLNNDVANLGFNTSRIATGYFKDLAYIQTVYGTGSVIKFGTTDDQDVRFVREGNEYWSMRLGGHFGPAGGISSLLNFGTVTENLLNVYTGNVRRSDGNPLGIRNESNQPIEFYTNATKRFSITNAALVPATSSLYTLGTNTIYLANTFSNTLTTGSDGTVIISGASGVPSLTLVGGSLSGGVGASGGTLTLSINGSSYVIPIFHLV